MKLKNLVFVIIFVLIAVPIRAYEVEITEPGVWYHIGDHPTSLPHDIEVGLFDWQKTFNLDLGLISGDAILSLEGYSIQLSASTNGFTEINGHFIDWLGEPVLEQQEGDDEPRTYVVSRNYLLDGENTFYIKTGPDGTNWDDICFKDVTLTPEPATLLLLGLGGILLRRKCKSMS